jgi:hypothetical protein
MDESRWPFDALDVGHILVERDGPASMITSIVRTPDGAHVARIAAVRMNAGADEWEESAPGALTPPGRRTASRRRRHSC